MSQLKSKKKDTTIFSLITPEQLVTAIVSLGDRINQLGEETWRLSEKLESSTSLWAQVIEKLQLDHTEKIRHALYNQWHSPSQLIKKIVIKKLNREGRDANDGDDGDIIDTEEVSVLHDNNSPLVPDQSLPLPQRPNTRLNKENNINTNNVSREAADVASIIFNAAEWKSVFSATKEKFKDGWTDIFAEKLKSSGFTCSFRFGNKHIKKGERKHNCYYLWVIGNCTKKNCTRRYLIILKDKVEYNTPALLRIKISGKENHDPRDEITSRQLRGEERDRVGQRANEIGPLAVFRERVEAADPRLLEAGNFTGCETIETIKKAASDYRKKHQLDENMFTECRIATSTYAKSDVTSKKIKGYVQVVGEMPFRLHLFSEPQIEKYIEYCEKQKYSFVHIDATGGIMIQIAEQSSPLLYAILFKDGTDPINDNLLAHAILTDNTVPSISFFLGNVAHGITNCKSKLILPSFFIIDFSAALMNSILQSFNGENIVTHLNRCWNVISRKYNNKQLRSFSFIHLCCCHVIHAMARSLTRAHINKEVRRDLLHIFSLILCGNDLEKLYDILGLIIVIFGDPNEQDAKKKFADILSWELNSDSESATMLNDREKIFNEAKQNEELELVDEYLRSNGAIIHQSPFNIEAIRRFPNLQNIINNKIKRDNNVNSMFSPAIIRIFYRWWAYLPLWTGLLWDFKERYSSNLEANSTATYCPLRHSNAVIESYFRTLKESILAKKRRNRPFQIMAALQRSIQVQIKAGQFGITQSSKGRKRRKKDVTDVERHKKATGRKRRVIYDKLVNKLLPKRYQIRTNENQSEIIDKETSESEENVIISSSNQSSSPSCQSKSSNSSTEYPQQNNNKSKSSSSGSASRVSDGFSVNVPVNLDESNSDDQRSEVSIEFEFDENEQMSSVINTIYSIDSRPRLTTNQSSYQPSALIDGHTLRWPQFEIKNTNYNGVIYNLILTCPVDSCLFALYFIYRTDRMFAHKLNDKPLVSAYTTLVETFQIVEKDGWDAARLFWLLKFNLIKPTDRQPISLYDYLDEAVFSFIKEAQRYTSKVTCERPDCVEKVRIFTVKDLSLFPTDRYIEKFEAETVGQCSAMAKRLNEISSPDARRQKYIIGKKNVLDYSTNKQVYIEGWFCNATNVASVASFDHGHPPMIIANIKPLSRRENEGYQPIQVRLRDMKRTIEVGSVEYQLRAVIHHSDQHFTATLLDFCDNLYYFDDQEGVRQVRNSTLLVEHAVYTRKYTFDDSFASTE